MRNRPSLSGPPLRPAALVELHAAPDLPQFWSALQRLIAGQVPYDAMVVYLNFLDFATSWRAARILATPNAERPVTWFDRRREVDMTPSFVLSQPQRIKLYRLSDVVPDPAELERTPFFRQFLAPGGWHHLAVALYWKGRKVVSEVALRRTRAQGDFTTRELAILRELHPEIEHALGRLLQQEEEREYRRRLEEFNQSLPFAILSLNWDLRPVFVNQRAYDLAAEWNFGADEARAYHTRSVFRVPPAVASACRRLRSELLARVDPGVNPEAGTTLEVVHPQNPGLVATIMVHSDQKRTAAHPLFAVHFHGAPARAQPEWVAPQVAARLSRAERELVAELRHGLSNKEIAARLGKSDQTIKTQLSAIYQKLGVTGRSRLLAKLA